MQASDIQLLLFDLDGTLYPHDNGYNDRMITNIYEFMHAELKIPREEVAIRWKALFSKYNQTYRGLVAEGYEVDKDQFWKIVRAGQEEFLEPDPEIRKVVESLPYKKWILTNAQEPHAYSALELLELDGLFDGVLGADFMGNTCKPLKDAFTMTIEHIGIPPEQILFFEDSYKNIVTAKALGMKTVHIAVDGHFDVPPSEDAADVRIQSLADLPTALPQLWAAK